MLFNVICREVSFLVFCILDFSSSKLTFLQRLGLCNKRCRSMQLLRIIRRGLLRNDLGRYIHADLDISYGTTIDDLDYRLTFGREDRIHLIVQGPKQTRPPSTPSVTSSGGGDGGLVTDTRTRASTGPTTASATGEGGGSGSGSGALSTGAKIAIGVVIPLFVFIFAAVLFFLLRRRKEKQEARNQRAVSSEPDGTPELEVSVGANLTQSAPQQASQPELEASLRRNFTASAIQEVERPEMEGNADGADFITVGGLTYQRVEPNTSVTERQELDPSAVVREVAELEGLGLVNELPALSIKKDKKEA
jgi:hypothetical protein